MSRPSNEIPQSEANRVVGLRSAFQSREEVVKPVRIRLEASTHCQLKCPLCPTTRGATRRGLGAGFLRLRDFKELLDANPLLQEIELSNYGEIFLNPELGEIVELGAERGVRLTAVNGVNLNWVADGVLETMVRCGFAHLRVSIDGASGTSYERYRRRGDLGRVIANLEALNAYKRVYATRLPKLTWLFIVFGHNEHEILKARAIAADLGMEFRIRLNWDDRFSPIRDPEAVRLEVESGVSSRGEYQNKYGVPYNQYMCHQLWDWPQINWNGKVLGCCNNYWRDFGGNAFKDGLVESLNTERIRYARSMLVGQSVPRPDIPCTTCRLFRKMRARGQTVKRSLPGPSPLDSSAS